jgi:TolA-binding protein
MKTIDYSYFIESFNAGEMDEAQKAWFLKELEGNESLQKEVMLRKMTDDILKKQDIMNLRDKLKAIESTRQAEIKETGRVREPRFKYAAVITGLIVIGSLIATSFWPQSYEKIYGNNFSTTINPTTSRSAESVFSEAMDYLAKKDFPKAIIAFKDILKAQPEDMGTEFYLGYSNLELKKFPDAEASFQKVLNNGANLYLEDASWYLAGCYIATKQKELAIKELKKIAGSASIYNKKARNILRHL